MQATEKDYEELERLGAKLHIAVPTAKWGFKLEAPDGEVIFDITERAHSWVRNAYNLLTSVMCGINGTVNTTFGDSYINVKASNGSLYGTTSTPVCVYYGDSMESPTSYSGYIGGFGVSSRGIVLGSGNTIYSFDDYKLQTAIVNGTAAGQLSYTLGTVVKSWDSVNKKYISVFSRIFNNNSSGDVIVSEGGIMAGLSAGGNNIIALVCRDVYDIPYTIPPAYKFTVNYTMSVQFPTV